MLAFIKHVECARHRSKRFSHVNLFHHTTIPRATNKDSREVMNFAPNHTTCEWQNQNLNPSCLAPEPKLLTTTLYILSCYTKGNSKWLMSGKASHVGNHLKKISGTQPLSEGTRVQPRKCSKVFRERDKCCQGKAITSGSWRVGWGWGCRATEGTGSEHISSGSVGF